MVSRRTFIAAGVAGSAALGLAAWWRSHARPSGTQAVARDSETSAIVAAIIPAMLAGMLPADDARRTAAVADTTAAVHRAIDGLPAASQRELGQLFALLAFPPARIALAGLSSPWTTAKRDDVDAFLERWRTSRLQLLRSAYDALHQLVFGAWYGQTNAWPAIGYPGPPGLG